MEVQLARSLTTPRFARHLTREWFRHWGAPQHVVDAGELVTCELVTNAVTYADGPGVRMRIRWSATAHAGYIEIWDPDPVAPKARIAGDLDDDGRGLLLVKAHASEWGHYPAAGGKVVWTRLAAHYVDVPKGQR